MRSWQIVVLSVSAALFIIYVGSALHSGRGSPTTISAHDGGDIFDVRGAAKSERWADKINALRQKLRSLRDPVSHLAETSAFRQERADGPESNKDAHPMLQIGFHGLRYHERKQTIFVSLSARDRASADLTLHDLFRNAKRPDLVWFGVTLQTEPSSDWPQSTGGCDPSTAAACLSDRIRYRVDPNAVGSILQGESMFRGESFVFALNAGTESVTKDWDQLLLAQWKLRSKVHRSVVLSHVPASPQPRALCEVVEGRSAASLPVLQDVLLNATTMRSAYASSQLVFGRSDVLLRVKIDPNVTCENARSWLLSAALAAAGAVVFAPPQSFVVLAQSQASCMAPESEAKVIELLNGNATAAGAAVDTSPTWNPRAIKGFLLRGKVALADSTLRVVDRNACRTAL